MRHDTSENNCDPSQYIMSPTLGSGKITWSSCSRNYLSSFLKYVMMYTQRCSVTTSFSILLEPHRQSACSIGAMLDRVWTTLPKACYPVNVSMRINSACSSTEKTASGQKLNILPTFVEIYTAKGIGTRGLRTRHWRVPRVEH